MTAEGVDAIVWDMFQQSGSMQYYLMFRALQGNKSRKEREREEIERLTR